MKRFLSSILIVSLTFSFLLSGCGRADTSSKAGADCEKEISAIEPNEVENTADPENTEDLSDQGAKVEIKELEIKSGKANGIDVSKWQGKINWKSVKAAGVDFAIIRIGYRGENGIIYKDSNADYNIQQAEKVGIMVGVYFFSTAVSTAEAVQEADFTIEAIKSYSVSYPVVYDCEGFENPASRMYQLSNAQRTDNALSFLNTVKNAGYDTMFYAARNELQNSAKWDVQRIENSHKIWIAHYPAVTYPNISNPDYNGKYDMWQYTNMGKLSGISGNTDLVVSYFTVAKAKPKSSEKVQQAKAPDENDAIYTAVNEQVTAKELVNLRDAATTKSNIMGALKNGEVATRTGVGSNGWSRLSYNGSTVYAITSYLTTDLTVKPVESATESAQDRIYTSVNEQVTAKELVNLRDAATTKSNIVGALKNGEVATRTGVGSNGWSRLLYNGSTVYAITSYLTADLNYKPPQVSVESEPNVQSDGFEEISDTVTAKQETNLRTAPSTSNSEVVYTLKNGEYLTRTGINQNGWSRLVYNGQTVYAVTSFLMN